VGVGVGGGGMGVGDKEKKNKDAAGGVVAKVHDMRSPFAFRLLLQELQAMSIAVRFEF